ncbi:MAG: protein-disulfide reductase DsbD family protein [Rhodoferax sp.]|uniref:protein-disulfide reductase DsbD family protein n=1 Tax=Rhodoferax sp. TaxID=50421 RepID=UPI00261D0B2C|nr:thioredoxin family protein [Rhodoferax sp.]MDD5334311.1 protein-disulfide reductase DsbD family protein [Rhodoferax sp.]
MIFSKFFARSLSAALLIAASVLPTGAGAQSSPGTVVTTGQVRAELMAHAPDGADAGKTVWLGLQLTHQRDWHTYWKNSGDSGLPTKLEWTLPAGVTAGDIAWPVPKKIALGNLANYGFDGTVLLPVPLTITPDFKPTLPHNEIDVKLKANWLVCRQECIPEQGEFALRLPVRGSTALNAAAFEASFKAQPTPLGADSRVEVEGKDIKVSVAGLPAALQGKTLELFPETPEVIETAAQWSQSWQGAVWTAKVPLSAERSQSPSVMPLLLVLDNQGQRQGFVTQAKVTGAWPQAAAFKTNASPIPATPAGNTAPLSFWLALLGALLGGALLNLMPCVFPVLAIKVMSFTRHANDRRGHRVSGLAYSAGVVLSFLALGALMLGLRSAGEQLGWGFQLQSPAVVAALAVLFSVMGLNLAGLFEFGQFLPSRVLLLEAKNPAINAFLSGVLAVAIASPCTAPFMGASLGLALALPALQALLIFMGIGVGMALPYLAASLLPALARALPRPGAWMDTFRRAMAFPMFATVVWLLWVLGQQTGIDGAAALLALLVAFSGVLWALTLSGRSRGVVASLSIVVLALLLGAIGRNVTRPLEVSATSARSDRWQPWAPGRVEQALAGGTPVFVDFTAAWCVTCQYNKKTTLANLDVLADLEAKKVTLLRADWTRRDPAISAALSQLGRNGVPVYVLYQAGRAPVLLSEVLSVPELRSALAAL